MAQGDLLKEARRSTQLVSELKERAKSSLYFLVKAVLGFHKLTPHLHQDFCLMLQDLSTLRKLVLMPRGHYKTTCGSIGFIIWLLIQDKIEPIGLPGREARILLAKENATLAEKDLSAIEGIFDNNELFRLVFADLIPDPIKRKRWNQEEMLINRESSWPEATIETIGVGGAKQGTHYDVIIYDDIIGDKAKDSETIMDGTVEWFTYSESLFISLSKGISNVLGTRWSKRDVYQHILDKDSRFVPYVRSAIEDGKPIFPEEFSLDIFDAMMKRNSAHYLSQYCNNPTDPSKCDFKEQWLRRYSWVRTDKGLFIKLEDDEKLLPFGELDIVGGFDPSIDEKPSASKRAIAYVGSDYKSRCFVLDTYSSRDTVDIILDTIFKMYRKWSPRTFLLESVALQKLFIPLLEREARIRRLEGKPYVVINCTPVKVSTQKSKETRIRDSIQSVAAEGRLYVRDDCRDFIEEFIDFPQGRTKDMLDAVSLCLNNLRIPESMEEEAELEQLEEEMLAKRSAVTGY